MTKYYCTEKQSVHEEQNIREGCWVRMTAPSQEEISAIAQQFEIDLTDVKAALDDEESSRVALEDGYTLILIDVPSIEKKNNRTNFTTTPLGILLCRNIIITVCAEPTPILDFFVNTHLKDFSTKKRMRFIYQILYRTAMIYQNNLRVIERRRQEIEDRIRKNTEGDDMIALHELETTMVYFATSLRANHAVIDRLSRYKRVEQYEEDRELLEDVIVENRQAIEMTAIYRDIIHGTRDLLSTMIDSRTNNVMKILTAVTLVMAIPTIISGLYGMNVDGKWMPLAQTPHGFLIICIITLITCIITMWILKLKKLL